MKKTLLLSVVASTMIMAGGDIAPVEPVVEAAPVASAWEFSGQAVAYYQTDDSSYGLFDATGAQTAAFGGGDLFDQEQSAADAGIQLRAANNDVFAGIGAGFVVNGLSTLNLENSVVSGVMQLTGNPVAGNDIDDVTDGGWIGEAFLTYGFGNTSIKAGRQSLPQSLSPFAYSETWNVFANTFDAVTVVNTDIANTTIVGGFVYGGNFNSFGMSNLTDFNALNDDDGVYMLTVQNKSITDLTLTGSVYYGADMGGTPITTDDVTIFWGDAAYNAGNFGVGIQGGMADAGLADDMTAFGAKLTGAVSAIDLMAAYSTTSDGAMFNLGGTTSALYTDLVADQLFGPIVRWDADKYVAKAGMDALGGNISAAYGYTDMANNEIDEVNVAYSVNLTNSLNLTATYAYIGFDNDFAVAEDAITGETLAITDDMNVVRLVARYNF